MAKDTSTKEKNWFAKHKVLTVILALIGIVIISSAFGGSTKTENSSTKTTTEEAKTEKPKFDIATFYGSVQSGMTKAEVVELANKDAGSCTETEAPGIGKLESCLWYGSLGESTFVSITLQDGKVNSKSKTGF